MRDEYEDEDDDMAVLVKRRRTWLMVSIAVIILVIALVAGIVMVVQGFSSNLSRSRTRTEIKDLNGNAIAMDATDGVTPMKPVDPPKGGILPTESAKADTLSGFSIPAIGLNHHPIRTMDSFDGTIDPPDCETMWADTSRKTSPGYYAKGHGRMIMAAHSAPLPGVCAGNLLEGSSSPKQTITRWPQVGDEVDVGQTRFRITAIDLMDRYHINENQDFHNAKSLIIFTCYRGEDVNLGDWRYQSFPRYTHMILAEPIA